MYPEYLPSLARAHQEDLLRQREFRESARLARAGRDVAVQDPLFRLRRRIGGTMVAVGERLIGQPSGGLELLQK
jgi:hypothetical protein